MDTLKYIITKDEMPIIFPMTLLHKSVYNEAKAAGFVKMKWDAGHQKMKAYCFGESISLNIASRKEEDEQLIEAFFNSDLLS